MKRSIDVSVQFGDDEIVSGKIIVLEDQPATIQLDVSRLESIVGEGADFFDALIAVRNVLERHDCKILCNGARKDAYASGMCRSMGNGWKVYILRMGEQATRDDLAETFGLASSDHIGTIEEQRRYFEDWVNSRGLNA